MAEKPTVNELKQRIADLEKELFERQIHDNSIIDELDTRYSIIFESVPTSIVILDKNGEIIDINPYHITHIGKGKTVKKDYLNHNILNFPSVVSAGLQDEHKDVLNGKSMNLKCIHYPMTTGGRDRFFNIRGVPLFKNNEVTGAVMIHEDISEVVSSEKNLKKLHDELELRIEESTAELKQEIIEHNQTEGKLRESESKYRSMMESMDDAVYICSSEYHIEYMNPAMVKRTGSDATGELCYNVVHMLDKKCPWCVHEKVMMGESINYEVISPKDDRTYYISNSPIVHTDGSISKLTIFRDITEFKKMENNLCQIQKIESIGTLAGGIAHDFNNILAPVIGHTEMILMDTPEDSPLKEHLNQIHTSALRARDLVKQILTFSRQGSSDLTLIKIQPVVKEVLKLIRSTIPTTIEIKQDINSDCGVIKADPTQIHQIVMNLATNAYHAMEETGGELKVSLKEMEFGTLDLISPIMAPGEYVCLTVSDTGTGMDKVITEKIFDPFFTTKAIGKGSGMGLSVVHGIVTAMGGAIQVYSESGKGTQFYVYFPIEKNSF
ncbi:MAG: PAS domain S-box protein [Desulfobacula sp.]|jgi:PAS domain S-box-containing protein|nr:PAS domain S-box protein [Desulfobacula sp.]